MANAYASHALALLALLLLPLLGSLVCALAPRDWRASVAWTSGACALAALAVLAMLAPEVLQGAVVRAQWQWLPLAGINFSLRLDGLAFLFALLVLGIGTLVVLYAAYYLDEQDSAPRLFALLLLFMTAMLGVVMAGDLVVLVVFWEATSLVSFLLVGYWNRRADARQGARMALFITGCGGLCLLAGVVLIGQAVGSYDLDVVLRSGDLLRAAPSYPLVLVLVLLAAFTKSAQFPFHFWLPHAMAAPTPVSAFLHSATLVKAGIFLLARLYPSLAGTELWFWSVSTVGLATLLLGAWFALHQHDLKGLLAYSTISHLGLITLLFGLDSDLAVVAAVFHVLNHAIFKASLFMSVGIVDHECGTRDLRRVNGLFRFMPVTSLLAITAAASMAGVPLLNGFLSKEMFFAEALAVDTHALLRWTTPLVATLAGMFSVAYSMRFIHDTFFNGAPVDLPRTPHEPVAWMRLPVLLLVLACLAVGLAPAWTIGPLLARAAGAALHGPLPHYSLAIWHGFTLPLAMSVVATASGLTLYFWMQRDRALHRYETTIVSGKLRYDRAQERLVEAARMFTATLQNGSLQRYVLLLLLTAMTMVSMALAVHGAPSRPSVPWPDAASIVLWGIGVASAVAATLAHRWRLVALLMLGAVGLVVSLAFAWLSAPDLALTQLLVEMASLLLMLLALRHLPRTSPPERVGRRVRDLVVALGCGAGMTLLTLAVLTVPGQGPLASISPYFLKHALPAGGGANVVNVILVDFRAFDTLGEITVLGIAALIVSALLYGFRPRTAGADVHASSLLLMRAAPLVMPLATTVSLYLLLRGHNLPGGGFIAGLVLVVALILQAMALGARDVDRLLRPVLHRVLAAGLILAVSAGAAAMAFSHPFLTSAYRHPVLPVIGELPLASAMVFDVGVYLVVAAAALLMLMGLGRAGTAWRR